MEITPQLMAPIGELNSLIDNDVCSMSDLIIICSLNKDTRKEKGGENSI